MIKKHILGSVLGLFTVLSAAGWGQKGHDTVAYIGESHFTPATKAAIDSLLDGKSIVYWANWLDNASHTELYAYSITWHYKNVDEGKTFENAPKHKNGDIVTALESQINILTDSITSKDDKALALKMVVHLLGDIHQPMHLGRATDRGGNRHIVQYFKSDTNLHSVWDSRLPESAHKWSYTEWQSQIDRASDEETVEILESGTPLSWAKETYEICKNIYAETPEGTNITYDYIATWTPVIEQQFLRGGLRLGDLLNSIFDPNYLQKNAIVKR